MERKQQATKQLQAGRPWVTTPPPPSISHTSPQEALLKNHGYNGGMALKQPPKQPANPLWSGEGGCHGWGLGVTRQERLHDNESTPDTRQHPQLPIPPSCTPINHGDSPRDRRAMSATGEEESPGLDDGPLQQDMLVHSGFSCGTWTKEGLYTKCSLTVSLEENSSHTMQTSFVKRVLIMRLNYDEQWHAWLVVIKGP